ncbi:MAG TPA: DUF1800 family protein [Pyrinomonadaceae bacterium]|jgi:uncharacterized protein (DUF1800 family)
MSLNPNAGRYWRKLLFALNALFLLVLSGAVSHANGLPPDAPILISEKDSTRALTARPTKKGLDTKIRVFKPGSNTLVTLFVANLDLLPGEGANAFRADMEDVLNRRYPLTVVSLDKTEREGIYALTVRLHEAIGDVGDVLTRVAWRGMSSNRVRVAIGHAGDGLKDDADAVPTPMPEKSFAPVTRNSRIAETGGDRIRFMEQAAFGPNAALDLRLRQLGFRRWIEEQMQDKADANSVQRFSTFPYPNVIPLQTDPELGCANPFVTNKWACVRDFYSMYLLQNWFYREALYGEDRQLRRRVSWALSQIWVVSGRDIIQSGRMLPYIKILDKYAFGDYRKLMEDMTLNPAMGQYLDMAISTRQSPNENYAREILQLFTIGVDLLNQDGTPVLDQNGNRIPAYTQENINNFTKVFTGWEFCNTNCANSQSGTPNYRDSMVVVNPTRHDTTQKMLLNGKVLPAGQDAEKDLREALDNIFYHPNVGPFVGKLLIQQLVTSNPSPAYVGRVAAAFNNNGVGIRGDMKAVISAILLDPEARGSIKTDPDYGKLREPVLFVSNFLRRFNPQSQAISQPGVQCNGQSDGVINDASSAVFEQDVFNPPSVFNYYQLDGSVPNTNLAGAEFAIFSTGTALKRADFIDRMVVPQGNYELTGIPSESGHPHYFYAPCGTRINLDRLLQFAQRDLTGGELVEQLNREMLHGSMSANVRNHILVAVQAVSPANAMKRVRTAVYLVATSSQFQVQR